MNGEKKDAMLAPAVGLDRATRLSIVAGVMYATNPVAFKPSPTRPRNQVWGEVKKGSPSDNAYLRATIQVADTVLDAVEEYIAKKDALSPEELAAVFSATSTPSPEEAQRRVAAAIAEGRRGGTLPNATNSESGPSPVRAPIAAPTAPVRPAGAAGPGAPGPKIVLPTVPGASDTSPADLADVDFSGVDPELAGFVGTTTG